MSKVDLSRVSVSDIIGLVTKRSTFVQRNNEVVKNTLDNGISIVNKKLVIKASNLIEDMWTDIKKGNLPKDEPKINIKPSKQYPAVLKPMYGGKRDGELLLEITGPKFSERIFLNRMYPTKFRYEKVVDTPSGHATLKYFDSQVSSDNILTQHVNKCVHDYLTEVFPPVPVLYGIMH